MITNKSLIQHVPDFLDYCNTEGLKNNTQENYKRFLDKFIGWLKLKKLNGLLPHQLTPEHILEYRLHLSCYKEPKTGKSLAKVTQSYYLIALRALLAYFIAKDIVSLPPDKITLYRGDKSVKNQNYPNPEQIKALLAAPGGKTPIALRDKVMLYTIVSAGLKIKQVINLNKNSINNLPENILPYIENYLKTRKDDKEDALFINYRSRKGASRRLTPRAIQKIIKRYSINVGLSSSTLVVGGFVRVQKRPVQNIWPGFYFEVGTVSAFKVWYNLVVMPNSIFILVPNDDFIIKFEN